jgi:F plasmid transfer operon, TraF, protein
MTIFVRGVAAALLVVCARPAAAQMYELVGTRAQGMGGAFVAVADDATATWWNPAGIATGATVSILYDRSENTAPIDPPATGPAWLGKSTAFAFATPAMGLSYYRLRISEIQPLSSNGGAGSDRQEEGATGLDLRTFALSEFGATVGQSLGNHLVVGSTLKLVRIGRALALDPGTGTAADRLEAAGSADVSSETDTDLDLGAMATFSRVRVGLSLKHLRQPDYGEGDSRFTLKRQARAGIAFIGGGGGPLTSITAAMDADLTRLETTLGEVRHLSAGAEAWLFERRLGLRGGVSTNTIGDTTNAMSVGASLGSRGGYYVDGYITAGSDVSREGWGLSIRLSF